ncbi:hypothetical protein P9A16_25510 [Shinella sp. 838]|uniref:hypothetical protein n=1 Tax=Shinella sp. 838 TaxID=3038164 RepID=UPI0024157692|nr:hypothetical protein [Shinella sp. 838]MDG4674492.1 hypothetical protein [Shinella sp. 838]
MADSGITVSGLTATGGVGQIALGWSVTEASCLPYLRLDKVEIWEATANNRDTAVKVAEIFGAQYVRGGLGKSVSRRYWIRARDASGNLGEWFPESPTAGILGTTTSTTPSANVLSDVSANAGSITAGSITGVTITGSFIRTAASGARVEMNSDQNALLVYQTGSVATAQIRAIADNTVASFYGNYGPAPVMNVQNDGNGPAARLAGRGLNPAVLDVDNLGTGSGRDGARIRNSGNSSGGVAFIGRASANGGYAFYAQNGGYGPFTGQHDAMIRPDVALVEGDIVVDLRVLLRRGIDDTLTEVEVANQRAQKGALGVVSRRVAQDRKFGGYFAVLPRDDDFGLPTLMERLICHKYDRLVVNSVGEGQINVCGRGGDIAAGDLLITSSMRGKAERQDDEIVYSFTVAKAREDVTFTHPDEVRLVACTYHCG